MRKRIDVWAGTKETRGYTQKHKPLLWENMLGTVYAVNPQRVQKYFDYDWEGAHRYIELDKYSDLRVCKVKVSYQGWPAPGKYALFGIPKSK